jgi:hypothetical protein
LLPSPFVKKQEYWWQANSKIYVQQPTDKYLC